MRRNDQGFLAKQAVNDFILELDEETRVALIIFDSEPRLVVELSYVTPANRPRILAELRRGFSTLPGTNVTIGQPISHRIDHMLSGTRANIAVKIFGDDLPTLRRLGEAVRAVVVTVPGAVDVSLEQQTDVPFVRFVLNRPAIARYGLRADEVAEAVETSLAGTAVGRIYDRSAAQSS